MIRLFDTAMGRVVPLEPRTPGQVSMYICGPTVYDVPHLGHGRFSLVFDVLRRYLEWTGVEVVYVSNVTDVDDNIIKRANEEGRTPDEVVAEYEAMWWDVMARLGVKKPTHDPHATAYVAEMVDLIGRLVDAGIAYQTSDGVYFASEQLEGYGLLARQSIDSLRAGARVEVVDDKRSPVDFALWKLAKRGEPKWPSPWGEGRPGWHTECVVMSLDLLGDGFDIHGGGQDLAFPHHENERAQAVALGHTFARHWVHNGFVEVDSVKMSKSLGNFTTLTDLLERTDPRAYRLLVLQSHYRSPVEITRDTVDRAEHTLRNLDELARRVAAAGVPIAPPDDVAITRFRERMDDDLDTPGAMAVVFDARHEGNRALDAGQLDVAAMHWATVATLCDAVGLALLAGDEALDPATTDLVARRDAARAERDWATADAMRAELEAAGWVVKDTPGGTQVHR